MLFKDLYDSFYVLFEKPNEVLFSTYIRSVDITSVLYQLLQNVFASVLSTLCSSVKRGLLLNIYCTNNASMFQK